MHVFDLYFFSYLIILGAFSRFIVLPRYHGNLNYRMQLNISHTSIFWQRIPHNAGSGKTYTIEGVDSDSNLQGIIPRAAAEIFSHIETIDSDKETVTVQEYWASYIGWYCTLNRFRDILNSFKLVWNPVCPLLEFRWYSVQPRSKRMLITSLKYLFKYSPSLLQTHIYVSAVGGSRKLFDFKCDYFFILCWSML